MKEDLVERIHQEAMDHEFIKEALQKSIVDPEEEIKEDQVILEVKQGTRYIPIFTLGNFSAVIGQAKSKKSFFASMVFGTMARHKGYMNLMPRIKGKTVLFDTEQGRYHVHLFAKRSVKIALSSDNLTIFSLRPYNTEERIKIIEAVLYSDDWKFAIIDGVRDLVTDINSPDQATRISNLLLKWTSDRNVHIMCVIHQNKADKNARGHIGSEVVNKSETVLSIGKSDVDSDLTLVKPEFMRGLHFDPFEIKIEDGIPVYAGELEDDKIPF